MPYKWRPSASQRRAFAIRMQDPAEQAAYNARKEARAEKRRAASQFDYATAGGYYVPTRCQHDSAWRFLNEKALTPQQEDACNQVISGYTCNMKVHHDYIHIVNEIIRGN